MQTLVDILDLQLLGAHVNINNYLTCNITFLENFQALSSELYSNLFLTRNKQRGVFQFIAILESQAEAFKHLGFSCWSAAPTPMLW
jgi:hypothetical protein